MTVTIEKFQSLLDRLIELPSVAPACRSVGVSTATFWRALQEAQTARVNKDVDSRFYFEWNGVFDWFDGHYNHARKMNILLFEAEYRRAGLWSEREIIHDGKIVYAHDPVLLADAQDPEVWTMLHGDRPITDTYLRNEVGL